MASLQGGVALSAFCGEQARLAGCSLCGLAFQWKDISIPNNLSDMDIDWNRYLDLKLSPLLVHCFRDVCWVLSGVLAILSPVGTIDMRKDVEFRAHAPIHKY